MLYNTHIFMKLKSPNADSYSVQIIGTSIIHQLSHISDTAQQDNFEAL